MRIFIQTLLFLSFLYTSAQRDRTFPFGQKNLEELQMKVYKKDTLAHALVLSEQANYYLDDTNDFNFVTDVYRRIKIFNKEKGQKYASIELYPRKQDLVIDIKAVSYNLENGSISTTSINPKEIFKTDYSKYSNKVSFTIPNVKNGSVIEYSYKIVESTLAIRDWYFQSDIPKLKSQFDLALMGNYEYNTRLVGFQELTTNIAKTEKECLTLPDQDDFIRRRKIPCAWYSYGVDSVPALKEEAYMLSPRNYLSRISMDLKSITSIVQKRGVSQYQQGTTKRVKNYTKTWKDADKALKIDFLNNQSSKKSFFKKKLPSKIFEIPSDLERAKSVYQFIQNHYNWNERNYISSNIRVKDNFDLRTGSVDEINLSLYNSLQAAKIESYVTLVSTRDNGIPTKLFPTIDDFNYLIVKAVVNGKDYFLDATDKQLPFGWIPFKCLNGEARVFDFKKGSYWQDLKVAKPSVQRITSKIYFTAEGDYVQEISKMNNGYYASNIRKFINAAGTEEYTSTLEQNLLDAEIESYVPKNLKSIEKPLLENIKIIGDESLNGVKTFKINPFYSRILENPFVLNERLYPVDFGHSRSISQRISFTIPKGYKVISLPKEAGFKLPNAGGSFLFKVQQKENSINFFLKRQVSKVVFTSKEYFYLKKFYEEIIKVHGQFIVLEKI